MILIFCRLIVRSQLIGLAFSEIVENAFANSSDHSGLLGNLLMIEQYAIIPEEYAAKVLEI